MPEFDTRDINEIMAADRANTKRLRAELEARQMEENPGKDEDGLYPSERPRSKQSGILPADGEYSTPSPRDEQDAGLDTVRRIEEYVAQGGAEIAEALIADVQAHEDSDPDAYDFLMALKASRDSWEFVTDDLHSAYLAGPMRGYVDFNYPLFNAVARYLRHCGLTIENPAESDAEVHERAEAAKHPLSVYMERDLADVARTDAVLVLPGWEQSEGATIEVTVAWMLGHPVYALPEFVLVPKFFQYNGQPVVNLKDPSAPPTTLPTSPEARKGIPIATGVLDYFPAALAEVAKVSKAGNDQHNPGEAMHWARGKSMDQADTCVRHLMERGEIDVDGMRHSAKAAWRALAILQLELEEAGEAPLARGAS